VTVSLSALGLVGFVLAQRLSELRLARRNTRQLLARGAWEVGASHYGLIVALHVGWLMTLLALGREQPVVPGWVAAYALLQVFRVWILASLGERWTTRIIVVDAPSVRRGAYRFLRHPNYLLVAAELVVVPLALGLPLVVLVFTLLNGLAMAIRIPMEAEALGARAGPRQQS
jgi:methyltransferase